ncbi:hypothetical protein [Streptomyces sp. Root1310]|uniref:hypothetical protein n=1 Tax=Streptomyces sp. Root1310 TaxID=1736452 RepID=UPI0012FEEF1C|nr:hypothetical protein [Streptomyces sp. Root1310]
MSTPDRRTTEGRTTDGRTTDGRTTEGRTTDGRTTDGRATEGRADRRTAGRPTLIPGPLAAQEVGVAPATIRKWVQLGHLEPAGKAGRAQLFRLEDVFAAERATRRAR